MSVLIKSQDEIVSMVEKILRARNLNILIPPFINCCEKIEIGDIVKILYNVNVKAFTEKYPQVKRGRDYVVFDASKITYNLEKAMSFNDILMLYYKTSSWCYQCCEIKNAKGKKIYKEMREYNNMLAHYIVRNAPVL